MAIKLFKKISPLSWFIILTGFISLVFIFTDCNWFDDFKHLAMDIFSLAVLVGVIEWLHDKNTSQEAVKAARGDFIYDNEIYAKKYILLLVEKIDNFLSDGHIKSSNDVAIFGSKVSNPFIGASKKIREILVIHRLSPVDFDKHTSLMLEDCIWLERVTLAFYQRYYEAYGNNFPIDDNAIPTERAVLEKMKTRILKRVKEDFS